MKKLIYLIAVLLTVAFSNAQPVEVTPSAVIINQTSVSFEYTLSSNRVYEVHRFEPNSGSESVFELTSKIQNFGYTNVVPSSPLTLVAILDLGYKPRKVVASKTVTVYRWTLEDNSKYLVQVSDGTSYAVTNNLNKVKLLSVKVANPNRVRLYNFED